jgi:Cu/Ag efflux protein CusF
MKKFVAAAMLAFTLAGFAAPVLAQSGEAVGEIRKIDKAAGKVTVQHGPITGGLDMPGMTMVFRAKDATLLDRIKVGEKVAFTILRENGALYILSAEPRP